MNVVLLDDYNNEWAGAVSSGPYFFEATNSLKRINCRDPSSFYLAFHWNWCGQLVTLPAFKKPVWQTLQAEIVPSAAC